MPELVRNATAMIILYDLVYLIMAWFTLEVIVRMFAYPSILIFFKDPINLIEFLSTVLFYPAIFAIPNTRGNLFQNIVRVSRLVTLIRLSRNTTSVRALKTTLYRSALELVSFFFYLCLGILFFGTICYSFEIIEQDTKFDSIPGI